MAVVDAYDDPNAVADLATYRAAWGLPACNTSTGAGCLTKVNEYGATSPLPKPAGVTGWATEESLDVDMVSAICPNCHIYLVEATGRAAKVSSVSPSNPRSRCYTSSSSPTPTAAPVKIDRLRSSTPNYFEHPGSRDRRLRR